MVTSLHPLTPLPLIALSRLGWFGWLPLCNFIILDRSVCLVECDAYCSIFKPNIFQWILPLFIESTLESLSFWIFLWMLYRSGHVSHCAIPNYKWFIFQSYFVVGLLLCFYRWGSLGLFSVPKLDIAICVWCIYLILIHMVYLLLMVM